MVSKLAIVRAPKAALEAKKASLADLWAALEEAAPEIATSITLTDASTPLHYLREANPGFLNWLLVEYALNTPTTLIQQKAERIREDQVEEGHERPWPSLRRSQIADAKNKLAASWQPIRARIAGQIERVGIINKNTRLLAYASLAEEIGERMWEERNKRTGELYLHRDYMALLKMVAEEMGEIGDGVGDEREGLLDIARNLAQALNVQGSGVLEHAQLGREFDYTNGEWREVPDDE